MWLLSFAVVLSLMEPLTVRTTDRQEACKQLEYNRRVQ